MALQSEKVDWVPCALCDSSAAEVYLIGEDRQYKNEGSFSYVKCSNCGLVYLNPRLTPGRLGEFYPIEEYYTYAPVSSQGYLEEIKDQMRMWVARNHMGYERVAYEERTSGAFERMCRNLLFRVAFRLFRSKFRRILPYTEQGRVLDIGCGAGNYLLFMKKLGWSAWGVEIEGSVCKRLRERGVQMHHGELYEADYPDNFFDWVTMNHSLEHVPNPRAVLVEVRRILKPGGSVFIGVPNIDSVQARVFGSYWYFLGAPIHLSEFSAKTLGDMLKLAGLEIDDVRFISGTQGILGSTQYIFNSWVQKWRKEKVVSYALRDIFLARTISSPLAKLIDWIQMGDCIEVIARKSGVDGADES